MLRRSRLLSHMTRSCKASAVSSLMASFGPHAAHHLQCSPCSSYIQQPICFTVLYRKGVPSKVYPWSLHGFPWGTPLSWDTPFLQRYLMTALILTFSIWSKWHTPSLINMCFMLLNLCKTRVTWSVIFNKISVSMYRVSKCQCIG
jgi:hypothetical protein